jgi:glycerophosphoryl diester phosphodiesterase
VRRASLVLGLFLVASCGGPSGVYDLDVEAVDQLRSACIATVVADPEGDDLAPGAGEHVVLREHLDIRNDLGGWWIEDADGNRLNVGIGTQIDPGDELRVHTGCGETTEQAVFNCLEEEVLGDEGDVLTLRDAAGAEVHRFAYGRAAD